MKAVLLLGAVMISAFAASPSHAMFKCTVDGKISYQEAPCTNGMGTTVKTVSGAATSATSQAGADSGYSGKLDSGMAAPLRDMATKKANDEAFNRYMASGDYDRALAFATDEGQRNRARQALSKKEVRCAELRIKRDEANANSKGREGRLQHAAEAAQARYDAECRK